MLHGHFVECSHNGTLKQAPDALHAVRVDITHDPLVHVVLDGVVVDVHTNNEDGDDFVCEVIGWGDEIGQLGRTYHPWKVKWEASGSRFCTIAKATSEQLLLAHIEVRDIESPEGDKGEPKGAVSLVFTTPERQKGHFGFMYLKRLGYDPRSCFVHLLISGKTLNRAAQRIVELKVTYEKGRFPRLHAEFVER